MSVVVTVTNRNEAERLEDFLWSYPDPVGLDLETTGCNPKKESPVGRARVWCMTIATKEWQAFIPGEFLQCFKRWLESDMPKVGTNLYGFDAHALLEENIKLLGIVGDTTVMSRLLNPASPLDEYGGHGLKAWGQRLGWNTVGFETLVKVTAAVPGAVKEYKKVQTRNVAGVPRTTGGARQEFRYKELELQLPEVWARCPERREAIVQYATQDAAMSLEVYETLRKQLEERTW